MRIARLAQLMVVLALASPLNAAVVVFQEDFNGTAGSPVEGWNDWYSDYPGIQISSTTIDQGNSAGWSTGSTWTMVSKDFTAYTPAAGETFLLKATLSSGSSNAGYADLRLRNSVTGDFLQVCMGLDSDIIANKNGSGEVGEYARIAPLANQIDVEVVLTDTTAQAFARAHGAENSWTEMGTFSLGATLPLSGYDRVVLYGTQLGGIDSISLTSEVPEPSTVALTVSGLIGLLAYAWRKRK